MKFSEEYRKQRAQPVPLVPLIFGAVLCFGGMLHMYLHSMWGEEDWGVVAVIVLGAAIMFNREVVALVRAWRGAS